jgi:phage baseplate assembly protein gpV
VPAETMLSRRSAPFKRMATAAHSLLPDGASEQQDREAVSLLQGRLGRRHAEQGQRPWQVAVAACAMAAVIVLWVTLKRDPSLSYTVNGRAQSGHDFVQAVSEPTTLRFSDGTEVQFERAAHGRVTDTHSTGARVAIESGTAHVSVTKRPKARWSFEAGPFSIEVTGTKFDVEWSPDTQNLEVRMLEGKVIVTGPMTGEGMNLDNGHRLTARLGEGWIRIDREGANVAPTATPESPSPVPSTDPPPPSTGDAVGHPVAATTAGQTPAAEAAPRPAWSKRLSAGDSASVLKDAERRGIDRTLADASSADLAALADAARYGGRTELSRRALLTQRERFAGSAAARDAAFLLGRLAEDNGSDVREAVRWYDTYLKEAGSGLYASEALGRKITATQRLAGTDKARAVAQEYLRRFPTGPYANMAHSLADRP